MIKKKRLKTVKNDQKRLKLVKIGQKLGGWSRKWVIMVQNNCKSLLFDEDASWRLKTREKGWKQVLLIKNGQNRMLTVNSGAGDWKYSKTVENALKKGTRNWIRVFMGWKWSLQLRLSSSARKRAVMGKKSKIWLQMSGWGWERVATFKSGCRWLVFDENGY